MADRSKDKVGFLRRKASQGITFCVKEERNASFKKVASILQKAEVDRTDDEKQVLVSCSDLVLEVNQRIEKRRKVKDRLLEVQDEPELLEEKCLTLAQALANSRHLVVYTGAGISTSACIPDYRGTNGIWTLLQQGKDIGLHDLTRAEPTRTHMALSELHRAGILRHVVSQNCDGLHLRSGLPKSALSEVHGDMYIEVCGGCKREYWRLFDVTENTARYSHKTMRRCYKCAAPLKDTIVHFGERGTLQWPLNWPGASVGADKADVILCMGSSLKVLKKYPWLWGMDKPVKKRPKLYIVNLQWTPKDDHAVLKISGKCDEVMEKVMSYLKLPIPFYVRNHDPIFFHATPLNALEEHTTSQPNLKPPLRPTSPSPNEVKQEEIQLLKQEIKPDRTFPDNVVGDMLSIPPENLTIKTETDFKFVKIIDDYVKRSPSQVEDPFCNTEIILANFNENCVGFEPGYNSIFTAFNTLGHFSVVDPNNPGFFAPLPTFPLPIPLFCAVTRAFHMDHNYSKQLESLYECETKSNSIIIKEETPQKLKEVIEHCDKSTATSGKQTTDMCSFCNLHYESKCCLYYSRYECVFSATKDVGSSQTGAVAICECCDYSDEEGDGNTDGEQKTDEEVSSQVIKVPIVNPGWYGKGCRKRVKKKR